MDVLPRPGKAPGAYMSGSAYDVHPYLHLNDTGDYYALSTFVHEWGHAIHTLLAHDAQPYETSNYSTFYRRGLASISRRAACSTTTSSRTRRPTQREAVLPR